MHRHAHQHTADDGDSIQPDVVQLTDAPGHEPLHPFIGDADQKARTGRNDDGADIGAPAARPVEEKGHEPVLDEMERLDTIDIRIAGADGQRIDDTNDHSRREKRIAQPAWIAGVGGGCRRSVA